VHSKVTTLEDAGLCCFWKAPGYMCLNPYTLHTSYKGGDGEKKRGAIIALCVETLCAVSSFAAIDARRVYPAPSHWVCIISGYRPYVGLTQRAARIRSTRTSMPTAMAKAEGSFIAHQAQHLQATTRRARSRGYR
jgi:hypothetical protein